MQIEALVRRMARFPAAVEALVESLGPDDARWRPAGGGWSVLEIVNHLADEELEDFRERLKRTLEDPGLAWPSIDPEAAVTARAFNERDPAESLSRLTARRGESVDWLCGLEAPDWSSTHVHPDIGPLSAADLLVSWAAHDALHLRQLARRMFQLAGRDVAGASTAYAGGW